jgi:hypothetical protein
MSGNDHVVADYLSKLGSTGGPSSALINNYERIVKEELDELVWRQDHPQIDERTDDILDEAVDFTPRFLHAFGIDPQIHVNTVRLIETVVLVGFGAAAHYKLGFKRPRPSQLERRLVPSILVPAHYAFPSGHATQAYLVMEALISVFAGTSLVRIGRYEPAENLRRIAVDVAENREWAGVHYPSDSEAGKRLAKAIWFEGKGKWFKPLLDAAREEWD